jgi:3-isopropylmalate dehydrogenase
MMLRYSFGLEKEARAVETAVEQVLSEGYYTRDIMGTSGKEMKTEEMGDLIMSKVGG